MWPSGTELDTAPPEQATGWGREQATGWGREQPQAAHPGPHSWASGRSTRAVSSALQGDPLLPRRLLGVGEAAPVLPSYPLARARLTQALIGKWTHNEGHREGSDYRTQMAPSRGGRERPGEHQSQHRWTQVGTGGHRWGQVGFRVLREPDTG